MGEGLGLKELENQCLFFSLIEQVLDKEEARKGTHIKIEKKDRIKPTKIGQQEILLCYNIEIFIRISPQKGEPHALYRI